MTMVSKMRGRKAALICTVAFGALFAGSPAYAISFFDRVFNTPAYKQHQRQQEIERKREVAPPPVRVSSPRYYTYKPDPIRTISLAELAVRPTPVADTPARTPKDAPESTPEAATATHDGADHGETGSVAAAANAGDALAPETTGTIPAAVETQAVEAAPEIPRAVAEFDAARDALSDMKIRALEEVGAAIKAHYEADPAYIWLTEGVPTARAKAVREALEKAADVGLDPADYAVAMPADLDALDEAARNAALMAFEMDFSTAVLTYVLDAERGRVDPNRLSGYHDLPRHKVDLTAALDELAHAADVATALEAHNPGNAQFKALRAELLRLRAADQGEHVEIAEGTFLKVGRKSPEVANIVAALKLRGSEELLAAHGATFDGYTGGEDYTAEIAAIVKDFQRDKKLTPDGVIGRNTIRALEGETNADKVRKIELAMERARWLPRELGERKVFINQAAFTATYTSPERAPLSMRVVVGKKSNQTNFFYDKIETVEFNPYWGVPYSIIVNEMMPQLYKDPTYLDRIGYEVTTASGREVSSASVDWHAVATKRSTINVRQRPGRSNALGELKILFPNKHHIYMHDTPAKSLFKKDMRAFSHGCVRLADPKAMAAAVLGKSVGYVESRIGQGKNDADEVSADIPVYVAYFTAWPDEDGKVGFYADVYDRDMYLERAIEATEKPRQARG